MNVASGPSALPGDLATDRYFEEVYAQLRALAGSYLKQERPEHTLQPTALVNEAYVRLREATSAYGDRHHFLALAARAMRQILIESARRRRAEKRRGQKVTLDDGLLSTDPRCVDLLALDDALGELTRVDEQRARIVELRFFAGLSCEEVADVLGVSSRTVVRQWRSSRAFLLQQIAEEDEETNRVARR